MENKPFDPEQERGERILREMQRLERRTPDTKRWAWLPIIITIVLVLAIVLVLTLNLPLFQMAWNRLVNPDSIPDITP